MNSGQSYVELKRTVSIHILAFSLFEGERFRRAFGLCDEETGEKLCDDLRLIYLEVPKYVRQGVPRSRLEYWLLYLAGMEARKMPEAMANDPMIGQALDLEKLFLQNREERVKYLLSYKAMRDAMTMDEAIRRTAEEEGRAAGLAQGRSEGRAELLLSLVRDGLLSVEEASSRAGMTQDEFAARMEASGQSSARPD